MYINMMMMMVVVLVVVAIVVRVFSFFFCYIGYMLLFFFFQVIEVCTRRCLRISLFTFISMEKVTKIYTFTKILSEDELRYLRGIENVVKCSPMKACEHHPIK